VQNIMNTLIAFATNYGIRILGAVLVLIIGRVLAGVARNGVRKGLTKGKMDPALVSFFSSLAYYLILIFTVLAALRNFGIETASLVAVMGAAGFAIGFAMQGALSNFAAGVMLLVFRPFKIGDYIDAAGTAGTVKEIHLFTTMLYTPDNVRVLVPNGKIFGDTIKNFTAEETRRIDIVMGIGYGSDIERAIAIMQRIMTEDERVLKAPEPQIAVAELGDSSVNLVVRPWSRKEDYWSLKFDLTRRFKESFDREGIEIPFPQRVVHTVATPA
jgi:small conductance mechanosensitive channel